MHITWRNNIILDYSKSLIISLFGDYYNLWSSILCSFVFCFAFIQCLCRTTPPVSATVMRSVILNNLFTFRNAKRVYNARHINSDAKLLSFGRWWVSYRRTAWWKQSGKCVVRQRPCRWKCSPRHYVLRHFYFVLHWGERQISTRTQNKRLRQCFVTRHFTESIPPYYKHESLLLNFKFLAL
jgi:hypothetical protein